MKSRMLLVALCLSSVSAGLAAPTLIYNGDFELGDVNFYSAYVDRTYYPASNRLDGGGLYMVRHTWQEGHPDWPTYGDHTSGSGLMFMANGATDRRVAWRSGTIPVVPQRDYTFTYYVSSSSTTAPPRIETSINGKVMGTVQAPLIGPDPTVGTWIPVSYTWNSGTSTTATIQLRDVETAWVGNDFALDDIGLSSTQSQVFGVFIGLHDTDENLRGDRDVQALYNRLNQNVGNFRDGRVIAYKTRQSPSPDFGSDVAKALSDLGFQDNADDILILHVSSHGGHDLAGTEETTSFPGDELLALSGSTFSDDEMYNLLKGLPNTQKWIFLDSCWSGGFWGDNNPNDVGDLEKLPNTFLLAAAPEGTADKPEEGYTEFDGTGRSLLSMALEDAFSLNPMTAFLHLNADLNRDGQVNWYELTDYIDTSPIIEGYLGALLFTKDSGDPVVFTREMWNPVAFTNGDPYSGIGYVTVPAPGAILLGATGAGLVGYLRRRRVL